MRIDLNDVLDLGDGINRVVLSKVYYEGFDYVLLVDEEGNKMLFRMDVDRLTHVDFDEIDSNLLSKITSDVNLNLDFNFDKNGMLKK